MSMRPAPQMATKCCRHAGPDLSIGVGGAIEFVHRSLIGPGSRCVSAGIGLEHDPAVEAQTRRSISRACEGERRTDLTRRIANPVAPGSAREKPRRTRRKRPSRPDTALRTLRAQ